MLVIKLNLDDEKENADWMTTREKRLDHRWVTIKTEESEDTAWHNMSDNKINIIELSDKESRALYEYQNWDYDSINKYLRGQEEGNDEIKEKIELFDSIIKKEKNTYKTLYRVDKGIASELFERLGITEELQKFSKDHDLSSNTIFLEESKAPDENSWNEYFESKLIGQTYTEKGFSTFFTKLKEDSEIIKFFECSKELNPYGIDSLITLHNVKDKNGVDLIEYNEDLAESEMLLERNLTYKINKVSLALYSETGNMYLEINASLKV